MARSTKDQSRGIRQLPKVFITCAILVVATHGLAQDQQPRTLATVAKTPITDREVQFEFGADPSQAQQAGATETVLEGLIGRRLLVEEALRRKLDKSPAGAVALARADDLALVALLQRSFTANLPPLDDKAISDFVKANPAKYAERKRFQVEQFRVESISASLTRDMAPLENMEAIRSLLDRNHIRYFTSAAVLDTLDMDPGGAAQVGKMKLDGVFITPRSSGALEVTRVRAVELVPVVGDAALNSARRYLTRYRDTLAAKAGMEAILKPKMSNLKVNAQYDIPKP